jgi:hypothetical protein
MKVNCFGLAFDAPDGRDDTAVVIVERADRPAWNLTVRIDELASPTAFAAWRANVKAPTGVVVDSTTERTVQGRAAIIVKQHLRVDRNVLRQIQAAVHDGSRVILITVSAQDAQLPFAQRALDTALASLTFGDTP